MLYLLVGTALAATGLGMIVFARQITRWTASAYEERFPRLHRLFVSPFFVWQNRIWGVVVFLIALLLLRATFLHHY